MGKYADISPASKADLEKYDKSESLSKAIQLRRKKKAQEEYDKSKATVTPSEKKFLEELGGEMEKYGNDISGRKPQGNLDIGDFEPNPANKSVAPIQLMEGLNLGQPGDIPEVDPRILLSKNSAELINSARRENPESVKPPELRIKPRQSHAQMKSGTQAMFQKRGDFNQAPATGGGKPSDDIPMPSSYLKAPKIPTGGDLPAESVDQSAPFMTFDGKGSTAAQNAQASSASAPSLDQLAQLKQQYPALFSAEYSDELEKAYQKRMLFRGATPLLVGLLAGNMGDAYNIAGKGLIEEDKLLRDQQELRFKSMKELMKAQLGRKPAKEPEKKYQGKTLLSGELSDGMKLPEGLAISYDPSTGKYFTSDGNEIFKAKVASGDTPTTFAQKRQMQANIDIASGKDIVTTTGPFGERGAVSKSQIAKGAGGKSFISFEPKSGLKPEQRKMFSQDITTLDRMTAKDREAIDSGELALKLLEEGKTNPSAANMGRYHLARMVEVGAMTNQDVNMPLGNLSAKQWSELWAERLKTGQVPEKIMDRMISTAKIIATKRKESLAKKRKTFSRSRAQAYKMSPDEMESLFTQNVDPLQGLVDNEKEIMQKLKGKTSEKIPDKATGKSDVGKMSTEELKKSIEDLKKSLK